MYDHGTSLWYVGIIFTYTCLTTKYHMRTEYARQRKDTRTWKYKSKKRKLAKMKIFITSNY